MSDKEKKVTEEIIDILKQIPPDGADYVRGYVQGRRDGIKSEKKEEEKMPIVINRKTGEVNAPEITQEQRDALWGELVRNYVRKHPEVLTEEPKEDKA